MTQRSPTYLKSRFEQNDIPNGTDYADLVDSFVNLETSANQTMSGPITFVTAAGQSAQFDNIRASVAATVASLYVQGPMYFTVATVSALGTTQVSAAAVNGQINHVFCTNQDRSVRLPTPTPGRVQWVQNTSVTALSVFPAVGGNFVGTAADASISIPVDQAIQVIHLTVSAYGVVR
jgi:hypothetical protein